MQQDIQPQAPQQIITSPKKHVNNNNKQSVIYSSSGQGPMAGSVFGGPPATPGGGGYMMERSMSFSSYAPNGSSTSGIPSVPKMESSEPITTAQKSLLHAQASSFGYFIPTDSQFNPVLPVLPRF